MDCLLRLFTFYSTPVLCTPTPVPEYVLLLGVFVCSRSTGVRSEEYEYSSTGVLRVLLLLRLLPVLEYPEYEVRVHSLHSLMSRCTYSVLPVVSVQQSRKCRLAAHATDWRLTPPSYKSFESTSMVAVQKQSKAAIQNQDLAFGAVLVLLVIIAVVALHGNPEDAALRRQAEGRPKPQTFSLVAPDEKPKDTDVLSQRITPCPYLSLTDLSPTERYPTAGTRHMVDPPKGGQITLVCCQSTTGNMNIAVHHRWAPKGAARFVEMAKEGYFSQVPLMRCLKDFICQFGLAGRPDLTRKYRDMKPLDDDPNWLPEGPTHKQNGAGVKRFAKGYMAYAGSGPNSRGMQFIVGLANVGPLAGGSPWEVPWGELVGTHSFETLDKIYTGYGEGGPSQGLLMKEGNSETVRQTWPLLDYITSCEVIDEEIQDEN